MSKLKIISFVIVIISLVMGLCALNIRQINRNSLKAHQCIHKTIYVERKLNNDQFIHIILAALRWTEATNHIIEFDVIKLPIHNKEDMNTIDNTIILNSFTPDFPEVLLLDRLNYNSTLGFFNKHEILPLLGIVIERLEDQDYEVVILHELGHAIGLEHNNSLNGLGTLMYPTTTLGANYITLYDLKMFCKIYYCDANKLTSENEIVSF